MSFYTFDSTMQGWSGGLWVWDAAGYFTGCLLATVGSSETSVGIGDLSTPCTVGDNISFRMRATAFQEGAAPVGDLTVTLAVGGTGGETVILGEVSRTINGEGVTDYDSGWLFVAGEITDTGTITSVSITTIGDEDIIYDLYIDNVYVAESEAGSFDFTRSAGGIPGSLA